jgi:hypothetical protein
VLIAWWSQVEIKTIQRSTNFWLKTWRNDWLREIWLDRITLGWVLKTGYECVNCIHRTLNMVNGGLLGNQGSGSKHGGNLLWRMWHSRDTPEITANSIEHFLCTAMWHTIRSPSQHPASARSCSTFLIRYETCSFVFLNWEELTITGGNLQCRNTVWTTWAGSVHTVSSKIISLKISV